MYFLKYLSFLFLFISSTSLLAMDPPKVGHKRLSTKKLPPSKKAKNASLGFKDDEVHVNFEELEKFFFPGEEESPLSALYKNILTGRACDKVELAQKLNGIFRAMKILLESAALEGHRHQIMEFLQGYIKHINAHPSLSRQSVKNLIKILIHEQGSFLHTFFLSLADLAIADNVERGFEALDLLANNKTRMDQFCYAGKHYPSSLLSLIINDDIGKKITVASFFASSQAPKEDFIEAHDKLRILNLYKNLVVNNLLIVDFGLLYKEIFEQNSASTDVHLLVRKDDLKRPENFMVFSLFPRLILCCFNVGKDKLISNINNFLEAYRKEAEKKSFDEIIMDLKVIFSTIHLNKISQKAPGEKGMIGLQEIAFPQTSFKNLQQIALKNYLEAIVSGQDPGFLSEVDAYLLRYSFREILYYYLSQKLLLGDLSEEAKVAFAKNNGLLLKLVQQKALSISYKINNQDALVLDEEIANINAILIELQSLNLGSTNLFIFIEMLHKLMSNNEKICNDIYWSPFLYNMQLNYSPLFKDILLHPEQSEASLEMRAKNFYLGLLAIWNDLADSPYRDALLRELALRTPAGLCMELRHKAVDTSYSAIKKFPASLAFTDTALLKSVSRNDALAAITELLMANFDFALQGFDAIKAMIAQMPDYIRIRELLSGEQHKSIKEQFAKNLTLLTNLINQPNLVQLHALSIETPFVQAHLNKLLQHYELAFNNLENPREDWELVLKTIQNEIEAEKGRLIDARSAFITETLIKYLQNEEAEDGIFSEDFIRDYLESIF